MAIFDAITSAVASVQTEVCIFLFAVVAHSLFFGKYKLGPSKAQQKLQSATDAKKKGGERERPAKALGAAGALLKALRPLLRDAAGAQALGEEIEVHLQGLDNAAATDVLTALLECMGKSVTRDVIAAVLAAHKERDAKMTLALAAWLLRGCLGLHMCNEFQAVLHEAETQHESPPPSIAMLALRAAVAWCDLEGALRRIEDLAPIWKATSVSSPSAAPQQTLTQVARLASEKGELEAMLETLQACGLMADWTLEAVLIEAVQAANEAIVRKVQELATESKIDLTPASYAALLRNSSNAAGAKRIFNEAVSKGSVSKSLLLAAAETALASQDAELAECMLKSITPCPSTEVAAAAVRLCAADGPLAKGDGDATVLRIYAERLQGADLLADCRAARLVAEAALRKNQPQVISRLVTETAEDSQVGPRRVALLKSFCAEHRLAGAQAVFRACPEQTACLFNALIDACVASKDLAVAEQAMADATQAGLSDIVTYNTMVKAYLHSHDVRRARACVDSMRKAGHAPNCVTYNELIDATIKKDIKTAWAFVEEMKADGLHPNHVTCSILLKSIQPNSPHSDIERTINVLDNMPDAMDEVLLSSVCEACIRVGRGDLLQKQLKAQRGSRAIQVQGAHTFGSIIRASGYVKDLAGVWATWREMKTRHIMPTSITLGCMVEALVTNGEVEAGYELIREAIADPQTRGLVNAVIYCSVLKGLSHQKRFDRVWSVYQEMLQEQMQFSIVTYNTLIDACARSCEMGRIPPLLKDMARQQIEPNVITYSTVLKGYCQEHRLDKAFEVLEDMKLNKKFLPDEVTYNTLLDGCARHGLYDRGMSVLKDMEDAGVPPSNFTLSVLVKLANRSHQPAKAFDICKDLCRRYNLRLNAHVYSNLVHACTAHGDLQRGLEVLEKMLSEHVRPDARTYGLLMRACLHANQVDDAVALLRGALGLNGTHPRIAKFRPMDVQPRGGLPGEMVSEILGLVAGARPEDPMVVQLLRDVRRVPGLHLDPRVSARLTQQAIYQPRR
mmetsp:Transcript_4426/g.11413  ORF Transcript_4426/g.11413 Transcript_4426/m.11413 type:complete len:1020 (-) Transcript_4426:249-3308(-)